MTKLSKSGKSDGAAKPVPESDPRKKKHDEFLFWIDDFRYSVSRVDNYRGLEDEEDIHLFEEAVEDLLERCDFVSEALMRYRSHEVLTLDEAFNIERPAGYRGKAAYREFLLKSKVIRDIRAFELAGAAKDDALYEAVGKIHGCGKTLVKQYWREAPPARRKYGVDGVDSARSPQDPEVETGGKRRRLPRHLIPHKDQVNWIKAGRKKR